MDSNGNEYVGGTDTLGRTDLTSTTATNTTGCVSSLPIASATIYSYAGPTGTPETLELCYGTLTYQTAFSQVGVEQVQNASGPAKTGNVIVTMILTDGTKYTLNWDSYGDVTSIGLPTGGSITYAWTEISIPYCANGSGAHVSRAVAFRTVNDGTTSRTWNYTWGAQQSNGSITNIATDPLGNSTVHAFSGIASTHCNPYETATTVYQGSNTSGQLLETVNTTYSGTEGSFDTAINVVPTSITTTVGNSVKLVTKTYDTGLGTGQPIFGDVVTEKDYDWSTSPPETLLMQTNTSYLWQTNSSYATSGLLDLPSSVVVENASGSRVAETDYTYDEPTYLTASGITTNHVAPLEGVRGNLSTVSKWLNTGSPVVSHTNWYDTGEPYQKIDPKGNKTTYAYSGTYAGAYPTTITNALGQITTNVYDASTGLLTSTTDSNGQVASFAYDTMFRKAQDTYPDGGQTSYCYTYDQPGCLGVTCYNVGRRTGMTDAGGSESWAYDKMGRELAEQRTSNSITKNTAYTYNLDGSLATLTYPSGRIITYAYSAAARPLSAIDTANSINYATSALYSPAGGLSSLTNGASLISTLYYNTRLQPCRISVKSSGSTPTSCTDSANIGNILDYTYNFSLGSANNGNVTGITNNVDTTRSQSFTYDHLNRILTAETTSTYATSPTHCWGESYTYDQWGNLTAIGVASTSYNSCTQESLSVTALSNNQLSSTGYSYDASGNMLTDGRNTYTWNAENQLKSVDGTTYTYTYDGDGHRVEKSNGKLYWYGTGSDPLMETDLSGVLTDEYIFFGGKRIARRDSSNNVVYYGGWPTSRPVGWRTLPRGTGINTCTIETRGVANLFCGLCRKGSGFALRSSSLRLELRSHSRNGNGFAAELCSRHPRP
ncbi:MAG TPA: hypothetical protein VN861_10250 [Candidatus Acidoferrales bacterium]|nr:hypothetical protein [Candidatus Acidoferrales bacterium]